MATEIRFGVSNIQISDTEPLVLYSALSWRGRILTWVRMPKLPGLPPITAQNRSSLPSINWLAVACLLGKKLGINSVNENLLTSLVSIQRHVWLGLRLRQTAQCRSLQCDQREDQSFCRASHNLRSGHDLRDGREYKFLLEWTFPYWPSYSSTAVNQNYRKYLISRNQL